MVSKEKCIGFCVCAIVVGPSIWRQIGLAGLCDCAFALVSCFHCGIFQVFNGESVQIHNSLVSDLVRGSLARFLVFLRITYLDCASAFGCCLFYLATDLGMWLFLPYVDLPLCSWSFSSVWGAVFAISLQNGHMLIMRGLSLLKSSMRREWVKFLPQWPHLNNPGRSAGA